MIVVEEVNTHPYIEKMEVSFSSAWKWELEPLKRLVRLFPSSYVGWNQSRAHNASHGITILLQWDAVPEVCVEVDEAEVGSECGAAVWRVFECRIRVHGRIANSFVGFTPIHDE